MIEAEDEPQRARDRVRRAVASARLRAGKWVAGDAVVPVADLEKEAVAEAAEEVKDIRYERSRFAWLQSRYAIGSLERRPDLPRRFVLVDQDGLAHGPYEVHLVVRSPLPGNPWVVASPDSESVFRVIAHRRGGRELWTEDDQMLKVMPLAE